MWYDNPYRTRLADTLPEKLAPLNALDVLVARQEKECANILITNFTDTALTFRVEPDPSGMCDVRDKNHPFVALITLKQAVPRLNGFKQRQLDPLVRLDEANLLIIPPYETRQLWLDIKGNLPAGDYRGSLSFVPVDNLYRETKVKLAELTSETHLNKLMADDDPDQVLQWRNALLTTLATQAE